MSCRNTGRECESSVFLPKSAEIISAHRMTASETHFTLRLADGGKMPYEPGQIVEAGIFGYGEIPLGLSSSPTQMEESGTFELAVRNVGRVSSALCALKAGDTMTIRGPLGNGFPLAELRGHDILIVAGGIGLCPTRSLVKYILARRSEFKRFVLFFGSKTPEDQLFRNDLAEWRIGDGVEYFESVDRADGKWQGRVGVITTLFDDAGELSPDTKVVVCGPPVMYKFVLGKLLPFGITDDNVFVDLERRMKCGIGKCGHCQINDKYVCTDGPVFRYSEVRDLEEAVS